MATRRTTRPPEPPRPAALTMSRADAAEKLTTRIVKADDLRPKVGPGSEGVEDEYKGWDSYNHDLLARMFTDLSVAREYDFAGPPARVLSLSESRYGDTWLGGPRTRRIDPEVSQTRVSPFSGSRR